MVALLERHGQGGLCSFERPGPSYDNSFLVADPSGALVLETVGRRWAVEAVRGPGHSISNGLTIRGFADTGADRYRTWRASASVRRRTTGALARAATRPTDLMDALRCHGPAAATSTPPMSSTLGRVGLRRRWRSCDRAARLEPAVTGSSLPGDRPAVLAAGTPPWGCRLRAGATSERCRSADRVRPRCCSSGARPAPRPEGWGGPCPGGPTGPR
jgi:hypothetical protein